MSWDYDARNKHCGRKLPLEMREDTWLLNGTSMNANHMASTPYFSHITNLQAILDGQPYSITTKSVLGKTTLQVPSMISHTVLSSIVL